MTKDSEKIEQGKSKVTKVIAFTIPSAKERIEKNTHIYNNISNFLSDKQIIKEAISFHVKGNLIEAKKMNKYIIDKGFRSLYQLC